MDSVLPLLQRFSLLQQTGFFFDRKLPVQVLIHPAGVVITLERSFSGLENKLPSRSDSRFWKGHLSAPVSQFWKMLLNLSSVISEELHHLLLDLTHKIQRYPFSSYHDMELPAPGVPPERH